MNRTNVSKGLVVGPGAAGLWAAIALDEAGRDVDIAGRLLE